MQEGGGGKRRGGGHGLAILQESAGLEQYMAPSEHMAKLKQWAKSIS